MSARDELHVELAKPSAEGVGLRIPTENQRPV
jgi:hypothetical protein